MTYYAHCKIEAPVLTEETAYDPATGAPYLVAAVDADGRQLTRVYQRGDEVAELDFRPSDWAALNEGGAIAGHPPETDAPAAGPLPEGDEHVTSGDAGHAGEEAAGA